MGKRKKQKIKRVEKTAYEKDGEKICDLGMKLLERAERENMDSVSYKNAKRYFNVYSSAAMLKLYCMTSDIKLPKGLTRFLNDYDPKKELTLKEARPIRALIKETKQKIRAKNASKKNEIQESDK